MSQLCRLVGIPAFEGAGRRGCDMGPAAFRAAGIFGSLAELGYDIVDEGDIVRAPAEVSRDYPGMKFLPEVAGWIEAAAECAFAKSAGSLPVFLGGDHCISAGTLTGMSRRAALEGRELFVLWLDAHPDYHTLTTSSSGNLHGTSVAYACAVQGFEGAFPALTHPVKAGNIAMMGLRSVDREERRALQTAGISVFDMRAIDENGVARLVGAFLKRVQEANGLLHVSLDVDVLDPSIAPGVGTTVPGGLTVREAHLVMEMLHDSGLVRSVDIVELNPFLDDRGKTAVLMVDLLASLMGRRVMDHRTISERRGF